ncbi:MAG: DMT family transporter [Thermoplasmatota archaeon]
MIDSILQSSSNDRKASKIIIPIAMISVSFAAIFIRFSGAHPISIAFYRMFFSSLILLIFIPQYLDEIKSIGKKDFIILLTAGLFLAVHFSAWFASLKYTTVASSVVLVTAHPLIVAWLSSWYLDEKTPREAIFGIIIAMTGIVIMTFSDYRIGKLALFGDILALIGMLAVAGYLIRGREMRRNMSLVPYAFVVYSSCAFFLAMFSVPFSTTFKIYPPQEYVIFFALAIIPTMLGHTLYNWALKYVKASFVSVSLISEPVLSSILAFIIFTEVPPTLTIIGAAVTLIGIYICAKNR